MRCADLMAKIILHSNKCPKCNMLKEKLDDKKIKYQENNDIQSMLDLGLVSTPFLEIDDELLDFSKAIKWISEN